MSKDFNFSEEELANLSDEERKAIDLDIEGDKGEENTDVVTDTDVNADPDSDTDPADSVDEPEPKAELEKTPEPAAAPAAKVEPVAETKPEPAPEPQPTFDERLVAINADIEKLGTQMEDGEIGFAEYNRRFSALSRQQTRIEIEAEQQAVAQQTAANAWQNAQSRFFDNTDHASIKEKPLLYNALSFEVSEVSKSSEATGKDFDWILNKAKENVEAGLGVSFGKKELKDIPVPEAKPVKKALDSVELPKTLGNIPAAQKHDTSEFDHLERMSVTDREKAIAKMSPEKLDQYLGSV